MTMEMMTVVSIVMLVFVVALLMFTIKVNPNRELNFDQLHSESNTVQRRPSSVSETVRLDLWEIWSLFQVG